MMHVCNVSSTEYKKMHTYVSEYQYVCQFCLQFIYKHMYLLVALKDQNHTYPWRRKVTTSMAGFKNGHIHRNLTQNGETPEVYVGMQKKKNHT